ncbi:MAG TPA: alpha-D-ribose 1-methylphosphonate 5-triphosphate diphosphatase [Spirochaetia bacterium]|nr:alpha-D-ribose 1-methylphosphonate 5-triphosphate diphosphatase [Spirochaetia bacterium]
MKDLEIRNVRIVTPTTVIERGTLVVRGGRITSLVGKPAGGRGSPSRRAEADREVVEGHGRLLLPGFIDLHNDGIEQEIEPRPHAVFPLPIALASLESQLVGHGITTIFHSFSFMDGREGTLHPEGLEPAIRELNRVRRSGAIRHLVHARYEIMETHHVPRLQKLIDDRQVALVSVMDHTPGQGQYRNVEGLVSFYVRKYNARPEDVDVILREREKKSGNPEVPSALARLAAHTLAAGLPLASHDDDSPAKVQRMRELGVTISEFPVDMEAALAASRGGMHVAVGAPNVLRGKSTNGNLNAREAIGSNAVDILCSDYYSPSMLHAVFRLTQDGLVSLPDAVRMATFHPARAAGLGSQLGSLEVGKRADMILVSESGGTPSVVAAWVGGHRVFEKHDGILSAMGERWASEALPADREKAYAP